MDPLELDRLLKTHSALLEQHRRRWAEHARAMSARQRIAASLSCSRPPLSNLRFYWFDPTALPLTPAPAHPPVA